MKENQPLQRLDTELVTAASQGDLASFGQLYDRYYRMAVGIARNRLSDEHLAEDAAQEAFSVAARTLSTLEKGERFPQWLGTICRRTASKMANRRAKHESLTSNEEPASDVEKAALRQHVHEVLEKLDDTSREIILLHYFSGMSYKDIASVIPLSTQAIHGRLQRARRKLRETLDPKGTKG